jgi:glyoxylase-like metal-dependent hydrolase (beta-lactamase superfamily II)
MKLYAVNAGHFKLDGGAMFGVVPKMLWNKLNPADENNLCSWAMRSLLIEDGNRLILVDTGMGNKQDAKFFGHYHLHGNDTVDLSLAKYGFSRKDITDVILTHLHFDHCGGSIERNGDLLVPAFSNATYWSNQQHWAWATQPNAREKASFLTENIAPIESSGQLQWVPLELQENNGILSTSFLPDLDLIFVSGHTSHMMLPRVVYKGTEIVFMGDLIPSVGHLPIPYVMGYDMFPLTTLQEKSAILEDAFKKNSILFFQHDPTNECCSLIDSPKGIRAGDIFKLSDL